MMENLMRIFLTGATGFIGSRLLQELLQKGHQVVALTRARSRLRLPKALKALSDHLQVVEGDVCQEGTWQEHLSGCDAVISLAGEPVVGRRWNLEVKQKIVESRIQGTNRLVEAIKSLNEEVRPKRFLSASGVGYYGSRRDKILTEDSPAGEDFMAQVCVEWEAAAKQAEAHGTQVMTLRFGMVLDKQGGALQKMLPSFRLFAGGPIGSGHQYISWIHRADVIGCILFCLQLELAQAMGPLNITAPTPVTMKEFAHALGQALHRPDWLRVPSGLVRLMFGESSEVLLRGQRVLPKRILELGYSFRHPTLLEALQSLLSS